MSWTRAPLEELSEAIDYGITASANFSEGKAKFLRITDIQDKSVDWATVPYCDAPTKKLANAMLAGGDIVFARTGATTGKSFLIKTTPKNAVFASYLIRVRPTARIDSNYLAHFFNTPDYWGQIRAKAQGAAQEGVNASKLASLQIPLPPLDEQKRIAAILDKADQLRQKRRQAIALLDSLTQSIFLEMFGDPVSNPKNWPALKVGDLDVGMTYGPRFYNEQYVEDGIRIVRITDLASTGELDYSAMPRLRVSDSELTEHRSLPGDILFARTGATVGKTALIRASDPVSIPGAYFIRMRFPSTVLPEFAWATLRYPSIQKIIFEGSRQSAQQNFTGPGLRRLPFILPPIDEQLRFAQSALRAQSFGSLPKAGVARLDALFSSLQHRAFTGQL